eukprot:gene19817-20304_t
MSPPGRHAHAAGIARHIPEPLQEPRSGSLSPVRSRVTSASPPNATFFSRARFLALHISRHKGKDLLRSLPAGMLPCPHSHRPPDSCLRLIRLLLLPWGRLSHSDPSRSRMSNHLVSPASPSGLGNAPRSRRPPPPQFLPKLVT